MDADNIVNELPKGILNWYDFSANSKVLYIYVKENLLSEMLKENDNNIYECTLEESETEEFLGKYRNAFDYIVAINVIEYCEKPEITLKKWKKVMKSSSTLLLSMDNRLGLKYFCGDRDPFSNRTFDGIENYRNVSDIKGRCYAKYEMKKFLNAAGFDKYKFYAVLPEIRNPQLIYAEDYIPNEELGIRLTPLYYYPDTVYLEEEYLYTDLINNGMFHQMANAYLVECVLDSEFSSVEHVTLSMDRGKRNAFATIINKNKVVEKRPIYSEGKDKVIQLMDNTEDLKKHGVCMINMEIKNNSCYMPFVEHQSAVDFLRKLAVDNKNEFIKEMDVFRKIIVDSSDISVDISDENEIILKRGYIDLVPLNAFRVENKFVFYDQEFYIDNCPANLIMLRCIDIIYMGDLNVEKSIPKNKLLERYGIVENAGKYRKITNDFLGKLRNKIELASYMEIHGRNEEVQYVNRQRVNYSESEYNEKFINLLNDIDGKKIILFGAGRFARRFIAQYKETVSIYAAIDNNDLNWGKTVDGVEIKSPDILTQMQKNEYKVIICVKKYFPIIRQLEKMGIENYGIFSAYIETPRLEEKQNSNIFENNEMQDVDNKKYNVGYIAGVFDLFHIGHLNMLKRAKEQCKYLIVGVVSDEAVKKTKPLGSFIPCKERIEIVSACKYVDKAVEIPFASAGTREAYRKYHFDCQFSGSDYENNPVWLSEQAFLRKHGSDMVFFSYTEGTSSTKLKKMIEKSLL